MKPNFTIIFILAALILSGLFVFKLHKEGRLEKFSSARMRESSSAARREGGEKQKSLLDAFAELDAEEYKKNNIPILNHDNREKATELGVTINDVDLGYDENKAQSKEIEFEVVKKSSKVNGVSVEYGAFTLDVGLPRNETVKVSYGIPLNSDGTPALNADNIVFYAPFMPERGFFKKKEFKWFPETAGYTIYSFDIVSDISEVEDRDKIYYYKESGFHELVFKVQEMLEKKFNLKHKKLLITGQSAGSTMAQQLGCYFSDKIDAVAVTGGHRYDIPKKDNKTAWLLLLTAGDDSRLKDHYDLQSNMRKVGLQMLHTEIPPIWKSKGGKYFHHTASRENWTLLQLFITGIVEQRDANNGIVPHYKKWSERITYDGQVWYMPSKEFAEKWITLPHENILELSKYKTGKFVYFIPKSDTPKAIVIYIQDSILNEDVLLIDNLYYLSKEGVVACSVRISDDYFKSLSNIENLLKEVQKKDEWKDLPIYVCGFGVAGQLAAVAALRKGERIEKKRVTKKIGKAKITKTVYVHHSRIKKITTINSVYDGPFSKLSIVKTRKKRKCHIPLKMIFTSSYSGSIPKKTKYREIEKMNEHSSTLGKKWFSVLSEIAKGR